MAGVVMPENRAEAVGAYEARAHFAELLERVESGEEITITRHGAPVARLVPIPQEATVSQRQSAVAAMRLLAARNRLGSLQIKDLIAEEPRSG